MLQTWTARAVREVTNGPERADAATQTDQVAAHESL
jgi:uncharacterized protein with GYD domain